MIPDIILVISSDTRQIAMFLKIIVYHGFYQTRSRIVTVGHTEYDPVALSDAFLLEHGGGIYIEKILFVVRKSYEMKTHHSYAAGHLPLYGGHFRPDAVRNIRLFNKSDHTDLLFYRQTFLIITKNH